MSPKGESRSARHGGAPVNGTWVMVCGPSGAGKDSVLAWVQETLAQDARICFARRFITRAAGPDLEHDEIGVSGIEALRRAGALAWHWQAHGYHYGVRAEYAREVAAGRIVVVNGSREHARPLAGRADVRTVLVTSSAGLLQQRLQLRGDQAGVLARNAVLAPPALDCIVGNDAGLETAGTALRDYLLGLAGTPQAVAPTA